MLKKIWQIWADTIGVKADENDDHYSDMVAILRTIITLMYIITNIIIVAGVIRHWN